MVPDVVASLLRGDVPLEVLCDGDVVAPLVCGDLRLGVSLDA